MIIFYQEITLFIFVLSHCMLLVTLCIKYTYKLFFLSYHAVAKKQLNFHVLNSKYFGHAAVQVRRQVPREVRQERESGEELLPLGERVRRRAALGSALATSGHRQRPVYEVPA